jgi:protein involved in polysaccharide export with SLBB domain
MWALHKNVEDNGFDGMTLGDRLRAQGGNPSPREAYRRSVLQERIAAEPQITPTMTYGTPAAPQPANVTVSGDVNGSARLELTINPGSALLDVVHQAEAAIQLAGRLSTSAPGSLGQTSPDANAPHPAAAPPPASATH